MTQHEILEGVCDDAYPDANRLGRLRMEQYNPLACVECGTPCRYGIAALKSLPRGDFERLKCGGDCMRCRQPCLLQRVEYMRTTTWARRCKELRRKSWIATAMRPYYEHQAAMRVIREALRESKQNDVPKNL